MNDTTSEPPQLGDALDLSSLPLVDGPGVEVARAHLGGQGVRVKCATGRQRAALRREAEVLRCVAGPGVVDLLAVVDDEEVTALILSDAGARTLADHSELGSDLLLRSVENLSEVVSELHERGWAHGQLAAEHVLVTPRGRVRLCSLGGARPAARGDEQLAEDLDALASLLRGVAAALLRRDRRAARRGRRLDELADRITSAQVLDAAEVARRVAAIRVDRRAPMLGRGPHASSAGTLLRIVGRRAHALCPLVAGGPTEERRPLRRGRGVAAPLTGSAACVLLVLGALTALTLAGDGAADAARSVAAKPADRTAEPLAATTPTVMLGGSTYRVGRPGDLAVVGDRDCDGAATALVLRPGTGELFELAPPSDGSGPQQGRLLGVHPTARDLLVEPVPSPAGPCQRPVLLLDDGSRVVVP